jgi:hypothetical protein
MATGLTDAAASAGYQFTSLSRTAQLIGALLARDGAPLPPRNSTADSHCSPPRPPMPPGWLPTWRRNWRKPSRKAACSTRRTRCSGSWGSVRCQRFAGRAASEARTGRTGRNRPGIRRSAFPTRLGRPPIRSRPDRWCCCKTSSAAMKLASKPGPAGADRQSGAGGAGGTPSPGAAATGCRRHPAHGLAWRSLAGPDADWQIEPDERRDAGRRTRNVAGPRRCAWSRRAWEKSTRGSA